MAFNIKIPDLKFTLASAVWLQSVGLHNKEAYT